MNQFYPPWARVYILLPSVKIKGKKRQLFYLSSSLEEKENQLIKFSLQVLYEQLLLRDIEPKSKAKSYRTEFNTHYMFIIGYKLLNISFRLVVTVTRQDLGTRLIIWYLRDRSGPVNIIYRGRGGAEDVWGGSRSFLEERRGDRSSFTGYKRGGGGLQKIVCL